jgi:hypothetical protein
MRRGDSKQTLVVLAMFLLGCTGSSTVPGPGNADQGSGLAFGDGGPGLPAADSGAPAAPGPGTPDGAVVQPDLVPWAVPDGPPASCPFGNLFATLPSLPPLCRPFPAAQPTPAPADPASCQSTPKVVLSAGPDQFVGTDTVKDWVSGMDGDDIIKGMGCSDQINGNKGDDWINGNMGNDTIHGGQGNDTIHGGQGNDTIWGDIGDDTISGDIGDDQYYYAEGEGNDVIEETGGHDTIICAPNYGQPKARLVGWSRVGNDLLLLMSGSGSVRVKDYYSMPDRSIDMVVGCQ